MVGGPLPGGQQDYKDFPFNLATEGHRQPGSAFKPFTLAVALLSGRYGPDSIIDSAPQNFIVPNSAGKEHFIVHNFGNTYSGPITLADATAISDNSVFSQVGISLGTTKIKKMAERMGIRSPISTNYSMILGGLKEGVTPLDMAHAYETMATGGLRVYNPRLGAPHEGPTGIAQIKCPAHVCGGSAKTIVDKPTYKRIIPASIAATIQELLQGVVEHGTGTSAQIPGVMVAGKTGTTSDYGDAWFVGWTPELTTAVWVGYPKGLVSMATDYNGAPVEGGTYPAIIWQNFMTQALQIYRRRASQGRPRAQHDDHGLVQRGHGVRVDRGPLERPEAAPERATPPAAGRWRDRRWRRRHDRWRRWHRRRWRNHRRGGGGGGTTGGGGGTTAAVVATTAVAAELAVAGERRWRRNRRRDGGGGGTGGGGGSGGGGAGSGGAGLGGGGGGG